MEITLRDTQLDDFGPLSKIVDDEWQFHVYSKNNALMLSEYFLAECVNGANRSVTLLVDGKPKGMLVLRDMGSDTIDFSEHIRKIDKIVSEDPRYDECHRDMETFHDIYGRSAKLYKGPDQAELSLLIIGQDCKGMGLGKRLMNEARRIAESYGKDGLFFYTDTECNFGFYDHLGAERVSTETTICAGEKIIVYCYRWMFPDDGYTM